LLRRLDEEVIVLGDSNEVQTKWAAIFYVEPLRDAVCAEGVNTFLELARVFLGRKTYRTNELLIAHLKCLFDKYYIAKQS
jgi:hypothetical protein